MDYQLSEQNVIKLLGIIIIKSKENLKDTIKKYKEDNENYKEEKYHITNKLFQKCVERLDRFIENNNIKNLNKFLFLVKQLENYYEEFLLNFTKLDLNFQLKYYDIITTFDKIFIIINHIKTDLKYIKLNQSNNSLQPYEIANLMAKELVKKAIKSSKPSNRFYKKNNIEKDFSTIFENLDQNENSMLDHLEKNFTRKYIKASYSQKLTDLFFTISTIISNYKYIIDIIEDNNYFVKERK